MPELPEVEVVRSGLAPAVTGARIVGVDVLDARSLKRHEGLPDARVADFTARLEGAVLDEPERRGKFLWIPLAGRDEALLTHLGMSGQVLLRTPDQPRDRLTRIVLDLEQSEHGELRVDVVPVPIRVDVVPVPIRVDFVDQRIFGSMAVDRLVPVPDRDPAEGQRIPAQVAHIARDPLDPRFDDARFLTALARKDTTVKRALLDQTLISGIGNIYADEALWAARVHYDQPTRTLSRPRARTLLAEVRMVLGRALAEGGTSFDAQYVNVNGASGYFSHSLNAYGQAGRPCPRCGRPIVRIDFMNRGSHLCPFCQRIRAPYGPRPVSAGSR